MALLNQSKIANAFLFSSRRITFSSILRSSAHGDVWYGPERAAGREMVGYGNGDLEYFDRVDHPYPALRFRKEDEKIKALREKEKGDWKALTMAEKQNLYRASFCLTFSEVLAPTGHWKVVTGFTMIVISLTLWFSVFLKSCIFKPMPESFSDEEKEKQMQRMIDLYAGPFTGFSSKWDYEKNRWKA
ncbi:Mitochondrial cytochrome c oxidase subunit [Trichinella nelsoni]|uniref:Cytochrome c oxidase subunit 4 n=1 Tax=Trichinella nelsoni TaxID=6336 RepID=A0A0V0RG51_9BILA|nr:Mitochondrial cytochrome c oxidase subunit [Trichinella nelsoni]